MLYKGRPPLEYVSLREKGFRYNVIDRILGDGRKLPRMTPKDREKFMELARVHFDSQTIITNREIARRFVIESATLIPKDELVDKLVDAVWGVQYFQNDNIPLEGPDRKGLMLSEELKEIEFAIKGEFIWGDVVTGYVELRDDGSAIIRTALTMKAVTDVYVLRRVVGELALKDGDEVECRVHYCKNLKCLVTHCIDKINGFRPSEQDRFDEVPQIEPYARVTLPCDKYGLSNTLNLLSPLCLGQNTLVSYSGAMRNGYAFSAFSKSLIESQVFDEVFPLLLGENESTLNLAREEVGEDRIVYSQSACREDDKWVFDRVLSYAKMAGKYGKKIAILVSDLDRVTMGDLNRAIEVISSGRAYAGGGSLTIIAFSDVEGDAYKIVRRNANARLDLTLIPFNNTYKVNAQNCYSFSRLERSQNEKIVLEQIYNDERAMDNALDKIKNATNYEATINSLVLNS